MATTAYFPVPLGTTSAVMPVTPYHSVCAGPAVLGGTVLVEFSPDGASNWRPWQYGTISQGGSYRASTSGYIRVTAATQNASVVVTDLNNANTPFVDQMANVNNTLACANATTEQVLYSIRLPAGFLPLNFGMELKLALNLTNNANVKTIRVRWGGVAGTALFTSPSVASALNYTATASLSGRGDGQTLIGFGAGASGGWGISTTAFATATADYINQETELVVTGQKATGTDNIAIESCLISLY